MLKFELSEQMIAIIGKALGAQPYEAVAPVIAELQRQINAQRPPAASNGGQPITVDEPVDGQRVSS